MSIPTIKFRRINKGNKKGKSKGQQTLCNDGREFKDESKE